MKKVKGKPVTVPPNPRQNKLAIDAVFKATAPEYLMILGAPDVVPHQDLRNLVFQQDDDADRFAWGDLPYACDERLLAGHHQVQGADPGGRAAARFARRARALLSAQAAQDCERIPAARRQGVRALLRDVDPVVGSIDRNEPVQYLRQFRCAVAGAADRAAAGGQETRPAHAFHQLPRRCGRSRSSMARRAASRASRSR